MIRVSEFNRLINSFLMGKYNKQLLETSSTCTSFHCGVRKTTAIVNFCCNRGAITSPLHVFSSALFVFFSRILRSFGVLKIFVVCFCTKLSVNKFESWMSAVFQKKLCEKINNAKNTSSWSCTTSMQCLWQQPGCPVKSTRSTENSTKKQNTWI